MAAGGLTSAPTGLARLQRDFQAWILGGAGQPPPVAGIDRRQVYADAYRARLREALAHDFPALRHAMGEHDFVTLAGAYLAAHPSTTRSVRWLGRHLASFMARCSPWREAPELAELAGFEWALGEAFDAADAPTLGASALARLAPEEWDGLGLAFHPSVRRLDTTSDVDRAWRASEQPDRQASTELTGPTGHWLIWRHGLELRYRCLPAEEAFGLDALMARATLSQLAAAEAARHDAAAVPGLLSAWLHRWLQAGLVTALLLPPSAPPPHVDSDRRPS